MSPNALTALSAHPPLEDRKCGKAKSGLSWGLRNASLQVSPFFLTNHDPAVKASLGFSLPVGQVMYTQEVQ